MSDYIKPDREILKEVLQRMIRVETRMMVLGQKLGHDLSDEDNISFVIPSLAVYVGALDTPLSNIIRVVHKAGVTNREVTVFFNGSRIGSVIV